MQPRGTRRWMTLAMFPFLSCLYIPLPHTCNAARLRASYAAHLRAVLCYHSVTSQSCWPVALCLQIIMLCSLACIYIIFCYLLLSLLGTAWLTKWLVQAQYLPLGVVRVRVPRDSLFICGFGRSDQGEKKLPRLPHIQSTGLWPAHLTELRCRCVWVG